jgi:hypothetical protein
MVVVVFLLVIPGTTVARNTRYMYPVADVVNSTVGKEKLGTAVKFYFGSQEHPPIAQEFGQFVSNLKTNAFNKSDRQACDWVFLSALLSLRDRAVEKGGDAVIRIVSFYQKNEVVSDSEYECHVGAVVAGVALKGVVVDLAK